MGLIIDRGVAQSGSVSALGAGGRWFESNHPDHFFLLKIQYEIQKGPVKAISLSCHFMYDQHIAFDFSSDGPSYRLSSA